MKVGYSTISGHRTRSAFDRYNVTNETDLIEAAQRKNPLNTGHNLGTNGNSENISKGVAKEEAPAEVLENA